MSAGSKRLLVVQVAGLGWDFFRAKHHAQWLGLQFQATQSVLPAVTCTVQAAFRTASPPAANGMVANGIFNHALRRPMFWEQSAALVQGERIWQDFRAKGGRVGMLFWQQSLGEQVDMVLSPAPIHKHHGGMIQDCYSRPADLYARLCKAIGRPFKLQQYWGPMASTKAGDWIASAVDHVLDGPQPPQLLLVYLPSLDYDLQRFGPQHHKCQAALTRTLEQLERITAAAIKWHYDTLIFGDYAMASCTQAVLPNLALREAGLLNVRNVRGMMYPDLYTSKAFAMVDHEIAHVYVKDPADVEAARKVLEGLKGVEVLSGLGHANSGQLVLVAPQHSWFAYPWWTQKSQAPDYASHVDIHNKPGYDPCELFFGWPPISVSQNTSRIRGTHGRAGPGREVAYATTLPLSKPPADLLDLARAVRQWLSA